MREERDWRGKNLPASNDRAVARVSDVNRQLAEDHVRRYRNSGVSESSVRNRINGILHLDSTLKRIQAL